MNDELLRSMRLDNGLSIEFYDRSNRYFGDYHRVCIVVQFRIVIEAALFADVLDGAAEEQKARTRFGHELLITRTLERMGVASAELPEVRAALIDSYLSNSLAYLAVPGYPARLLRNELAGKSPRRGLTLVRR
jgi:hypothetical protein